MDLLQEIISITVFEIHLWADKKDLSNWCSIWTFYVDEKVLDRVQNIQSVFAQSPVSDSVRQKRVTRDQQLVQRMEI